MGQRFVCTINRDNKDLAKIYFHWSAYTYSALDKLKGIIACVQEHECDPDTELQLALIKFCEENGGGIRGEDSEFIHIQGIFPNETFKRDDYSRNDGLIAISEKGMQDLQDWSEGDATINMNEDIIEFGVYGWYECLESYNEERQEWDDDFEPLTLEEVPDIGCDLSCFGFDELDDIIACLDETNSHVVRNGNEIFELIG